MNYYIERHDMEIILDALEALHKNMLEEEDPFSTIASIDRPDRPYTLDEVDGLFQSLENSGEESWDLK